MSTETLRLLIVDDIADNRELLSRRFGRRGFDVVEAEDGVVALDLIDRQRFDLVLLDIVMPNLDGIEVLKRIRASHSPASLPVIMVTARSENKDVVEALELGANDYLTKPIDFSIAFARVQAQLARKQAEDALQRANADLNRHVSELATTNRTLEAEIAERKRSEARVHYMERHDPLTGLGNRAHLRDELAHALAGTERQGGNLAVLCLGLDQFKLVNETLGHPVGDALLHALAARLRACTEPSHRIARLGGDEFAVIQVGPNRPEAAAALAHQIMEALAAPYDIGGRKIVVTASAGVAIAPSDGSDPDLLLKNADMALYRAKRDGPGSCRFFEAEMDARAQARWLLEADFRKALAVGEFEVFYQPLINIGTGAISGCEALVRWRHPERGMIQPSEFIPLAEEIRLIGPLGEWVLRQACTEATRWPAEVRIAVNLSPLQFRSGALALTLVGALAASGLAPNRLELEITESVLLNDDPQILAALNQIRDMGVRISLDDFGTGYSSLSYLRSFPFDKIKIDQCFVRDLSRNGHSMAIVRALTGLGRDLGITITAEGVETEEQLELLSAEGCNEAQGYLISRPAPAKDIRLLLADRAKAVA